MAQCLNSPHDFAKSRSEIIEPSQDPLVLLFYDLSIRRFITTNYDLEIERLFGDVGFANPARTMEVTAHASRTEWTGNMGGQSREIVLTPDSAADFLDFASGTSAFIAQVAHVHGRATDHDDVVVTEKDYQNAYVGDDQGKTTAREGLEVLFGGNPILFIGLSLAEGDVMRPLREFAAAAGHLRRNNSIFAVKEASKPKAKRDAFALQQFIRHRVYVQYYGFRTPNIPDKEDQWINAGMDCASWPRCWEKITIARSQLSKNYGLKG